MEAELKRLLELYHGERVLPRKEEIQKEAKALEAKYMALIAELKKLKVFTDEDASEETYFMNYEEDTGRVARGEKPLHFFLHPNGELSLTPPSKVKREAKTKLVPVLSTFDGLPELDGKGKIKMKRVPL